MLFSSLTFLFFFLPILGIIYFIIPRKFIKIKNIVLLIFSLLFYSWGEPKNIVLMLLIILISYIFGILIARFDKLNKQKLKLLCFVISIIIILGTLFYFKYTGFLVNNINHLLNLNISIKEIILPIGISFYTFQILSYIIDLYRNKISVQKNFFNLALYISFFPQLIAGPIVTYKTIEEQLDNRKESFDKIISGLERFIIGLGKKIIIANNMAIIADAFFNSADLGNYSFLIVLIGSFAYTFQIYFDFSGYSDMAIGLGKIFGFEFLENFNYPYMASSITDFWKRWHISLTSFFREYLYIPLGGNRVSIFRWIVNMLIVWLLTGFWHGAAWNFIVWGLYNFIWLIIERKLLKNFLEKVPKIIKYFVTICIINFGWIIFRVNSLSDLTLIIQDMFESGGINFLKFATNNSEIIAALPYMALAIIFSTNIFRIIDNKLEKNMFYNLVKKIGLIIIFVSCISFLVSSLYNPFIYFRF